MFAETWVLGAEWCVAKILLQAQSSNKEVGSWYHPRILVTQTYILYDMLTGLWREKLHPE